MPGPATKQPSNRLVFFASAAATLVWAAFHAVQLLRRAAAGVTAIPGDQLLYLQFFENMIHLRGSGATTHAWSSLFQNHFSPILFAWAPLYGVLRLAAGMPDGLLLLSAITVGSGSLLMLLYARRMVRPELFAVFAFIWIVGPALNYQFLQGFREAAIGIPVVAGLLIAWRVQRLPLFVTFAVALLAIREDYGLVLFGFVWLSGGRSLAWKLIPLSGPLAVAIIAGWLLPFVAGYADTGINRFAHLGSGFWDVLLAPVLRPAAFLGTLASPENLVRAWQFLAAFGLLPLLAPRYLLCALPYYVLLCLDPASDTPPASIRMWYVAPLLPILGAATLEALARLDRGLLRRPQALRRLAGVALPGLALVLALSGSSLPAAWFPALDTGLASDARAIRRLIRDDRPLYAPPAIGLFFGDHPRLRLLEPGRPLEGQVVAARSLANPHLYGDYGTVEEYARAFEAAGARRGVSYSGQTLVLFGDDGQPARGKLNRTIESEYTAASITDTRIVSVAAARVTRRVGARGLLGQKRSGLAMIGPRHAPADRFALELSLHDARVPRKCCGRREPSVVILEGTRRSVHPLPCPLRGDQRYRLEIRPQTAFVVAVWQRGCGVVELDRYSFESR